MNFEASVLQVPIEDIIPNRFQPRLSFEDNSLQDLADSIRQHGIIQPLVLRKTDDKYEIVAGERRYKAAKIAGLATVPAVITQIDDKKSAEIAIVENVQRREITAVEEAKSYKALLDQGYMSIPMLAQKMGLSVLNVENKLKLLDLADDVQNAVIDHKISERHARSLLAVEDKAGQISWLNRIINERLTVKQLDDLLKSESGETKEMINNEEINNVTPPDIFGAAPIDLGEHKDNATINDLESQAVNMQTQENSTIFDSIPSTPNISAAPIEPIETLETLDFEPPKALDINIAVNKINQLVEELKNEGYNINLNTVDNMGQKNINIEIKTE